MTAQEFNDKYPIGTMFRFTPVMGRNVHEDVASRSEAWVMCGSVIVSVTGRSGGVDIEHLQAI